MAIYDVYGNQIPTGGGGGSAKDTRSILHQGWHADGITGNSKSAFVKAFENGFAYVEADLNITADNVLVMSHDSTSSINYADWKVDDEHISFDDFLTIIKKTNLNVYLDGKAGIQSYLSTAYDMIMGYDLLNNFTMIGTAKGIHAIDSNAIIAYDPATIPDDLSGYTDSNIIYSNYVNATSAKAQNAIDNGFIVELYTLSTTGNFINCFNNIPQASRWCTDNFSVDAILAENI